MKINEFITFMPLMFISGTVLFAAGIFSLAMISAYHTYKFIS
jgi:hypothetical protein